MLKEKQDPFLMEEVAPSPLSFTSSNPSNQLHIRLQLYPPQHGFDLIHLFSGEVPKAELTSSFASQTVFSSQCLTN